MHRDCQYVGVSKEINRRSLFAALVLLGIFLVFGVAVASGQTAASCKVYAHLTKTSFRAAQAGKVRLVYRFAPKSMAFSYTISLKRKGRWHLCSGSTDYHYPKGFTGPYTVTVKKLFSGDRISAGSYRLALYPSDMSKWSKMLTFRIIA